jgi:hypothetical protein
MDKRRLMPRSMPEKCWALSIAIFFQKDPTSRVLQEQLPVKAQRLPSWPAQPIPLRRTTSSLDEPVGCGGKVELLAFLQKDPTRQWHCRSSLSSFSCRNSSP